MASSVTVRRTFEVPGYAPTNAVLHVSPFISRSAVFDAGGFDWSIYFYPDAHGDGDMIGIYLRLETPGTTATAQVGFSLLDPSGSRPAWKLTETTPLTELTTSGDASTALITAVIRQTVSRTQVNAAPGPGYLMRGGLLLECTVTVVTDDAPASASASASATQPNKAAALPPSDLMEQLRLLHATEDGADVTYSVDDGTEFRAHKTILALRSPVFKAELYRWAPKEEDKDKPQRVEVKEIKADAFRALLHYIYTDTLLLTTTPDNEVEDDDDRQDDEHETMMMVRDLLVAADRYGVERLRLMCEDKLCKMLDVENVANILAFADDHHFETLKDACIEFMMTSDRLAKVMASEGYLKLRSSNPSVLVEVLEKSIQYLKV